MSAASYKMTEMIPLTSAHLIDRSKDAIFELVQGHPTGNFEKKTLKQQQSVNKVF